MPNETLGSVIRFGVFGNNNAELIIAPGETRTLKWVPTMVGVFPFYCTNFCSALHQEMQGYLVVWEAGKGPANTGAGTGNTGGDK